MVQTKTLASKFRINKIKDVDGTMVAMEGVAISNLQVKIEPRLAISTV